MAQANRNIIQFPSKYAKKAIVRPSLQLWSEEDIYKRLVDSTRQKGMKVKYAESELSASGTVISGMQYVLNSAVTTSERLEVLLLLMVIEHLNLTNASGIGHVTTTPERNPLENRVVEFIFKILQEIELMGTEDSSVKAH